MVDPEMSRQCLSLFSTGLVASNFFWATTCERKVTKTISRDLSASLR